MKKHILVIDDEQGIRDLMCFLLEPLGFKVTTAKNGLEGVAMFKKSFFDIVFLDVHMPKLRGPETLKMIKDLEPEQIVIMFSSSSDPEHFFEEKAKNAGAFECIYKPFDIDDLQETIDKALCEDK